MKYDSNTTEIKILGYPLKHSLSPTIQQAAIDYYNLPIIFHAVSFKEDQLETQINALRNLSCHGANVTIPYKEAVIPLLDELDVTASKIGAVNTIVNQKQRLIGFNTDADGFITSFSQENLSSPENKSALIIGAGGAARAAAFALIEIGIAFIVIANRNEKRAYTLINELHSKTTKISYVPIINDVIDDKTQKHDLIINATPYGMMYSPLESMTPLKASNMHSKSIVFDMVYIPTKTPLLYEAEKVGAQTISGSAMLINQGAQSFELWTGKKPPKKIMLSALNSVLNNNGK